MGNAKQGLHISNLFLSLQEGAGEHWKEVCCALCNLCPRLEQLSVEEASSSPISVVPLQGLRCLRSLNLTLADDQVQGALSGLATLSALTSLTVVDSGVEPLGIIDASALGCLQGLCQLYVSLPCAALQGLPAIATGCSQLTRLGLCVRQVDPGITGQSISSSACSDNAPWWPSLEQFEVDQDEGTEFRPGHLTGLHLDRAHNLSHFRPWEFGLNLRPNCPLCTPDVLGKLCQQLAALPAGVCPDTIFLWGHRCA